MGQEILCLELHKHFGNLPFSFLINTLGQMVTEFCFYLHQPLVVCYDPTGFICAFTIFNTVSVSCSIYDVNCYERVVYNRI